MSILIDFYSDVIKSFRHRLSDDGYIYVGDEGEKIVSMGEGGRPIVLPTQDHIETLLSEDEDGNIVISKILYNPLRESAIKGNGEALNKTKQWAERRIGFSIAAAGEMLLHLVRSREHQAKTSLEINKFLARVQEAKNIGMKEIVDDTTIDKWGKLFAATLAPDKNFVTLYINKSGKVHGEKFNRATILSSPVYDELLKADKDTAVYGIKLRNKDLVIFKIIFEYILTGIDQGEHTLAVGSNDNESPAFISLMTMYHNVISRTNEILLELRKVSEEIFDLGYIDLLYTVEDLNDLSKYKTAILEIPDEIDINRNQAKASSLPTMSAESINTVREKPIPTMEVPTVQPQPVYQQVPVQQPVQAPVYTQPVYSQQVPYNQPIQPQTGGTTEDRLQRYLAMKGELPINQPQVMNLQQYPVMQPQYNVQQPLMGANRMNMGMAYQQPVYQQPMQVQMPAYQGPMNQPPLQGTNSFANPYAPRPYL